MADFWSKFPNVKIYVVDIDEGSQYYFQFSDSGYVKTDDWIDVKTDKFIKEIRKNYEANNADREKNNQPTKLTRVDAVNSGVYSKPLPRF